MSKTRQRRDDWSWRVQHRSTSHDPATLYAPELVDLLSAGDEAAFVLLVDAWSASMHRLAEAFVGDPVTAGEVVQQAWHTVIDNLAELGGGPSLQHGVYRILVDAARRRAGRDLGVPVAVDDLAEDDPAVPGFRFRPLGVPFPRHWTELPAAWPPEDTAQAAEIRQVVLDAIQRLPPSQRAVLTLRDIEGYHAAETGAVLDLAVPTQLALLHRGRAAVRMAIEEYLRRSGDRPARAYEDPRAHR
jgi:RNA polymerase sigma-70 factor (ECF subfamily)